MVRNLVKGFMLGCCFFSQVIKAQQVTSLEQEESMVVNSGEAQYDGKQIVLVGKVNVQHSLGQISARRLTLLPSSNQDGKHHFALLKISEDIHVEFKGGGELYCQEAEIDYHNMKGLFLGSVESPDVIYNNLGEEKKDSSQSSIPFEVKSDEMIVHLYRQPATPDTFAKTVVKEIKANQNVRVLYHQDYVLLADHAFYQRLPSTDSSSKAGLLTLSGQGINSVCQLTNLNGDRLQARTIQLNTNTRQLWLEQPQGVLMMRREKFPFQTLEFSAKELTWDDEKKTLQLKNQIHLTENGTVHIETDDEISIRHSLVDGKQTLSSIESPRNTHLSYLDVQKGNTHQIYCPGSLVIDHERQQMILEGLSNLSGQIEKNEQVFIEDVLGEMYADRIQINYTWIEQQLVPVKMILEGHVRLLNRFDGHLEESSSILHYALADRVDYVPKEQEMILQSVKGNRVLLFDKVNNVQMSAPSLKVWHDPSTHKDSIQGVGDVRFTFLENELQQFKQHFRLQEFTSKESKHVKPNK